MFRMGIPKRLLLLASVSLVLSVDAAKPRIIVSSDIGGTDPDDHQSMIHFLVYSDLVDVEGLISSPPGNGRRSHIIETLDKYKTDYANLKTYGAYPTHESLVAVTAQGATVGGAPSKGRSTPGSKRIISAAKKSDSRPLYILVWGSITDVAQAVYEDPSIKSKIRVYYIGSWNTQMDKDSRNYLFNNHKDLWWIENDFTFRGMYEGGNQSGDLGNESFVTQHVKGHGALGDFFHAKMKKIKMGDSPSFLYLISPIVGGVGNWNNPTSESWGGKFKQTGHGPNYWTDLTNVRSSDAGSVNKWREKYLRDWQYRMDRLRTPKGGATPPPTAPPSAQSPFKGKPFAVPGSIQAEDFDNGGQGVAYHDVDAINEGGVYRSTGVDIQPATEGGYNIGWIRSGEWLEYTVNVASAGTYTLAARVASTGTSGKFRVEFNGSNKTGSVGVPNTGNFQKWTTVSKSVNLSAGQQVMRVYFEGSSFNLNYISITKPMAKSANANELLLNPAAKKGEHSYILPEGMQGVVLYDLSGRSLWEYRAEAPGAAFALPAFLEGNRNAVKAKYLP